MRCVLHIRARNALGLSISILAFAWECSAAPPLPALNAKPKFHGVAVDEASGRVYITVNNRHEVWVFDKATRERLAQVPVGEKPTGLALSRDGKTLACLNHLEASVSLIRLSDLEVYRTMVVPRRPASVAALPDGRFAVVSPGSDAVTLIDPADHGYSEALPNPPKRPVGAAGTVRFLGIISRASRALHIYENGAEVRVVELDDIPTCVEALPWERFAVATASRLLVVDAFSGSVLVEAAQAVDDLVYGNDAIYVLCRHRLEKLDSELKAVCSGSMERRAQRLAVCGNTCATVTFQARAWQLWDATALVVIDPVPGPAPAQRRAQGLAAGEKPPEKGKAAGVTASRERLIDTEVHAPGPGPPSAMPLRELSQRTLSDALRQPTEFGSREAGFEPPDWTQPFKDVEADNLIRNLETGAVLLKDNVRLRLGDMYLKADAFSYSEETGEIHAKGHINIDQRSSWLVADEIFYWPLSEADKVSPPLIAGAEDEQERAKKRLALGRLEATNVVISEPTREMYADRVDYDFKSGTGELTNVRGHAGIYYYAADKLHIRGPQALDGEDVWVTTCDRNPPHYTLRTKTLSISENRAVKGAHARLELGRVPTPFYLPRWRRLGTEKHPWSFDLDSGRKAALGYFVNTGYRFELNPYISLGPRLYPTEKQGLGVGLDLDYDFMENPASFLYRTKGEAHGLYVTEERGYGEWYHRYEYSDDLVLRAQVERWFDPDFYKDFYYDEYRDRTAPRIFTNVTFRQPGYIATGTARLNRHGWVYETERLPEATFHLLERRLAEDLYLTFDTVNGYNEREQGGARAARSVNVARMTYDLDLHPAFSVTPFLEGEVAGYSEQRVDEDCDARASGMLGVTLQTRFNKVYPGCLGFSAFKHVVLPSVTVSHRPESTMDLEDMPRFDALDSVHGRARIETKFDNILYGRDEETEKVWKVTQLTFFQGNDFWNEYRLTEDYEIEMAVNPRPWWGIQLVGERHIASRGLDFDAPFFRERLLLEWYEKLFGVPYDPESEFQYNAMYGAYDRFLAQTFYDESFVEGNISARLGFAYTQTRNRLFNRQVLYGMGYKLGEHWGLSFDHVYDLEGGELRNQSYEIKRSLHCWEAALRLRERGSGLDIDVWFNIKAFPGSHLKI